MISKIRGGFVVMTRALYAGCALLFGIVATVAQQGGLSDDAGRVLALETAWNHAIETKDTKAIDMLLADSMIAVESDGAFATKSEYLAGIKAADFQPSQAVNEKNDVHMYGDTAVAVGIFRIKEMEKGKTIVHRERTIDTWVKVNGTWKCVAAVAVTIPSGKSN
ncbi:MAG TPA: nuclear transport factor 2 family protein [Candidatus Dormibacteraeota bacterium]|jgi:ketosteroid isomerase-like protein|nr:nuclear transport factor 2 family protein [Candidatus Dormibacteraeota bacterium]